MMSYEDKPSYCGPAERHQFGALLFDMDGTIIDSTPAIVKFWTSLGSQIGVPGDTILKTSHGRRSIDVLRIIAPHLANWEYIAKAEGQIPLQYGNDAVEIPGSRDLLANLDKLAVPWAIVTSGTRPLVEGWLGIMNLTKPGIIVTAEDVVQGKPDPSPYLLGAKRLAVNTGTEGSTKNVDVLVLEDAPSGVRAGKAAGYKVVALATTHAVHQLQDAGADWIVQDLRSVVIQEVGPAANIVTVEFRDILQSTTAQ